MDWIDYREKLGLGFQDKDKVEHFYTKLFNVLNILIAAPEICISFDEYFNFCDETGSELSDRCSRENISLSDEFYGHQRFCDCINIIKDHLDFFKDFLSYYIWFVNSLKSNNQSTFNKEYFINLIKRCLDESHIQYDILNDNDKYFIFPKGAKELDNALVSEPLEWLKEYPNAHKAFIKALKAYASVTEENASDVADLFRKALETFFQEFFVKEDKSLENLKSKYGNFLSEKGVPGEIKNNFEKLLEAYTNYNNHYAKHHDKASLNVLEYIMYQTGNLIRLIITLNQEDTNHAD